MSVVQWYQEMPIKSCLECVQRVDVELNSKSTLFIVHHESSRANGLWWSGDWAMIYINNEVCIRNTWLEIILMIYWYQNKDSVLYYVSCPICNQWLLYYNFMFRWIHSCDSTCMPIVRHTLTPNDLNNWHKWMFNAIRRNNKWKNTESETFLSVCLATCHRWCSTSPHFIPSTSTVNTQRKQRN